MKIPPELSDNSKIEEKEQIDKMNDEEYLDYFSNALKDRAFFSSKGNLKALIVYMMDRLDQ